MCKTPHLIFCVLKLANCEFLAKTLWCILSPHLCSCCSIVWNAAPSIVPCHFHLSSRLAWVLAPPQIFPEPQNMLSPSPQQTHCICECLFLLSFIETIFMYLSPPLTVWSSKMGTVPDSSLDLTWHSPWHPVGSQYTSVDPNPTRF